MSDVSVGGTPDLGGVEPTFVTDGVSVDGMLDALVAVFRVPAPVRAVVRDSSAVEGGADSASDLLAWLDPAAWFGGASEDEDPLFI